MSDTRPRHPVTGRFLAFDCEIDCQEHCAGLCPECDRSDPWADIVTKTIDSLGFTPIGDEAATADAVLAAVRPLYDAVVARAEAAETAVKKLRKTVDEHGRAYDRVCNELARTAIRAERDKEFRHD